VRFVRKLFVILFTVFSSWKKLAMIAAAKDAAINRTS